MRIAFVMIMAFATGLASGLALAAHHEGRHLVAKKLTFIASLDLIFLAYVLWVIP